MYHLTWLLQFYEVDVRTQFGVAENESHKYLRDLINKVISIIRLMLRNWHVDGMP